MEILRPYELLHARATSGRFFYPSKLPMSFQGYFTNKLPYAIAPENCRPISILFRRSFPGTCFVCLENSLLSIISLVRDPYSCTSANKCHISTASFSLKWYKSINLPQFDEGFLTLDNLFLRAFVTVTPPSLANFCSQVCELINFLENLFHWQQSCRDFLH